SLVTDAHNVHLFGKAFRHANNRIVCQRPSEPVQCSLLIRAAFCSQLFAFDFETDALRNRSLQSTLRPFNLQFTFANCYGNALWHRDYFSSYARHFSISDFGLAIADFLPIPMFVPSLQA